MNKPHETRAYATTTFCGILRAWIRLKDTSPTYPCTANADSAENPVKPIKFDVSRLLKMMSCGII